MLIFKARSTWPLRASGNWLVIRRREFIAGLGGAAAWSLAARAQQRERVRRIGFLTPGYDKDEWVQLTISTFRQELAKFGWVEDRTLHIDYRFSGSDPGRMAADAEELVNLRPEVIFAFSGPAARAVLRRTQVIPIVFAGGGDPGQNNLAGGIARPTGNITGFANNFVSLGSKWVELLKRAAPTITRVAHLTDASIGGGAAGIADVIDAAAAQLAINLIRMPLRNPEEIERAIDIFAAEPNGGLLLTGGFSDANLKAILRLALQDHLPTMFGAGKLGAEGLLMSNGPDIADLVRGASSYVDRILRGAKPGDLPVQFPTRFPLLINLKTAKAIGLDIPPMLLALADDVIE
jgi:putative ABC transport system substrate-binding protein